MALVEIQTKPTGDSVIDFLNKIEDETKRNDSFVILEIMKTITKLEPVLWGPSLIGFGDVIVKSPATGREVRWFKIGFSPRKANLSLYLDGNLYANVSRMKSLGKHKTGKGCLYVNRLSDVSLEVLQGLIKDSFKD